MDQVWSKLEKDLKKNLVLDGQNIRITLHRKEDNENLMIIGDISKKD